MSIGALTIWLCLLIYTDLPARALWLKRSAPINIEFVLAIPKIRDWWGEFCFLISAVCSTFVVSLSSSSIEMRDWKIVHSHGENRLESFITRFCRKRKTLSKRTPLIINLCHKNCLEIYFLNSFERESKERLSVEGEFYVPGEFRLHIIHSPTITVLTSIECQVSEICFVVTW